MKRFGIICTLLVLVGSAPTPSLAIDICSEANIVALSNTVSLERSRCVNLQSLITDQTEKLNALMSNIQLVTERKANMSLKRKINFLRSKLRASKNKMKWACILADKKAKQLNSLTSDCTSETSSDPVDVSPVPSSTPTPTPTSTPTPEPTKIPNPRPIVCEYPAPPLGCHYEQGESFDPITQCGLVLSCGPIRKEFPLPMMCEYPAPPLGCEYVAGPSFDTLTQCGLELQCNSEDLSK